MNNNLQLKKIVELVLTQLNSENLIKVLEEGLTTLEIIILSITDILIGFQSDLLEPLLLFILQSL